jgi:(p)ppGpp synthase/HD superfamily hydrolase
MNPVFIKKVRDYAIKCHSDRNQKYCDDLPYSLHLQMAVNVGESFIGLIPVIEQDDVIAGIWCHDLIEDTGQTYNDVLKNTNETVAEYAFALTNEKGRNRKERANDKYYTGIKEYKHATFIKLCDRIANMNFSRSREDQKMFKMYKKEMPEFKEKLYDGRFDGLWLILKLLTEE